MNSLIERQIREASRLEERQKRIARKPLERIHREILATLETLPPNSSLNFHFEALRRQTEALFQALNPDNQVSILPGIAGYTNAIEEATERFGVDKIPELNLQILLLEKIDSVQRISNINSEAKSRVFESLQISLALGESAFQSAQRLRDVIPSVYWKLERIARTVTTDMLNSTLLRTYSEIARLNGGNWLKEYVAVGDFRTTDICLGANGEQKKLDEIFGNGVLHPPAHPNCRSRIVLVKGD